jgi:hypothetical protein
VLLGVIEIGVVAVFWVLQCVVYPFCSPLFSSFATRRAGFEAHSSEEEREGRGAELSAPASVSSASTPSLRGPFWYYGRVQRFYSRSGLCKWAARVILGPYSAFGAIAIVLMILWALTVFGPGATCAVASADSSFGALVLAPSCLTLPVAAVPFTIMMLVASTWRVLVTPIRFDRITQVTGAP